MNDITKEIKYTISVVAGFKIYFQENLIDIMVCCVRCCDVYKIYVSQIVYSRRITSLSVANVFAMNTGIVFEINFRARKLNKICC